MTVIAMEDHAFHELFVARLKSTAEDIQVLEASLQRLIDDLDSSYTINFNGNDYQAARSIAVRQLLRSLTVEKQALLFLHENLKREHS